VDVVVVVMHWGDELTSTRSESELRHYLHLKQLGAHLIIGCHPHVLQAHTVDNKTFTAFSLGNFVFGPTKLGLDLVGVRSSWLVNWLLRCCCLLLGCSVARLLGCSVARLLGCSVARLLGCLVARLLGCSVARLLGCLSPCLV